MLLDTYAPLKKINKYKLKFKSKPWITPGLQKSIFVKNKLLTNFINKKDPILKEEFHTNYKKYRNLLSTLMKKSKQAYYDKYFERNWNNIKNTWKGIKSLISLKTVASNVPTVLSLDNGDTITNPYDIANTFNNYFASIAETTKRSIKYSHKHFSDYLSNESSSIKFLQPPDKEEITNIIWAIPRIPDGAFREINGHSKNRRKECQFILDFLDSPMYQQITKKYFSPTLPRFFNYLD